MSLEGLTPEQTEEANQKLWDEVAAEGKNGKPAAEKPLAPAKPAPAPTPAPEVKPDPMKEVLARLDKFEASHNTLAGHIGGLNRGQQELRQLLATAQAAAKKVDDAPTAAQVNQAISDPQEWAELKRQHPEWAAATEKGI